MMSCTVRSPTDSLAQPTCILVYIECNPAPGGSPFELSLGLRSNSRVLLPPFPLRASCVVVCPRFCLGSPQSDPIHLYSSILSHQPPPPPSHVNHHHSLASITTTLSCQPPLSCVNHHHSLSHQPLPSRVNHHHPLASTTTTLSCQPPPLVSTITLTPQP